MRDEMTKQARFFMAMAIWLVCGVTFIAAAAHGLGNRERAFQEDGRR